MGASGASRFPLTGELAAKRTGESRARSFEGGWIYGHRFRRHGCDVSAKQPGQSARSSGKGGSRKQARVSAVGRDCWRQVGVRLTPLPMALEGEEAEIVYVPNFQGLTSQSSSGRPMQGVPGSTVDNGRGQGRRYGPDRYPETDTDKGHDHNGAGDPHSHDWGRPANGSPPTHEDRGPPRPVRPGDPVAGSNPPPKPPPKKPHQN